VARGARSVVEVAVLVDRHQTSAEQPELYRCFAWPVTWIAAVAVAVALVAPMKFGDDRIVAVVVAAAAAVAAAAVAVAVAAAAAAAAAAAVAQPEDSSAIWGLDCPLLQFYLYDANYLSYIQYLNISI